MDQIIKQLRVIEDVSKRLEALSQARGIADDVSERMKKEADSLSWAHKELVQIHFGKAVCVIGQKDLVEEIEGLKPEYINHIPEHDLISVIIFDAEKIVSDRIHQYLIGPDWPGDKFPEDKMSEWLFCERYYACGDDEDPSKRAVLLHCFLKKDWLNDVGLAKARLLISSWLLDIYQSMQWDKFRKV